MPKFGKLKEKIQAFNKTQQLSKKKRKIKYK